MFKSLLLALILFAPGLAGAQDTDLLVRWQADQAVAVGRVTEFQLVEFSESAVEGGSGTRHIAVDSGLSIDPGDDSVLRLVRKILVNGRPYERRADRDRGGDDRRPRSGQPIRDDVLLAADSFLLPGRVIHRLKPTGRTAREDDAGRTAIRVETTPDGEQPTIERVSIWFDAVGGQLIRTRAVLLGGERGTVVVDTRYQRIRGVDLPVSRRMEGSMSMRRRMRTFTVLLDSSARYTEHRVVGE